MSAFSRGRFFQGQFHATLRNAHFFLRPRFLSSTSILRAVTKSTASTPLKQALPKKQPLPTTKPLTNPKTYKTYATLLSLKPHPTLLYQAPGHAAYIVSSYITGGFCLIYAAGSFWSNYLRSSKTINEWVPLAFVGICVFMSAAGGYFLLGPAWIVKTITALPEAALKAATTGARVPRAARSLVKGKGNAGAPELTIEVELKKMLPLPFFPARKMYVLPSEIRLQHQLAGPSPSLSASQGAARRAREEAERAAELEYERTHIMSAPIRHMSRVFFDIFLAVRRTLTREGFTGIYIKGYKYKLDVSGGWALDGGKAIDRLVQIKEHA